MDRQLIKSLDYATDTAAGTDVHAKARGQPLPSRILTYCMYNKRVNDKERRYGEQ